MLYQPGYPFSREQKEENKRQREAQKQKRDVENSKYAPISVDYDPELWKKKYKELHADTLEDSINMLQQIQNLKAPKEAELKLFDLLFKITLIESNLIVNGDLRTGKLYENVTVAVKEGYKKPFESEKELEEFMESMIPVFKKRAKTNSWQNTGTQFRRFCQFLAECLQNGCVIGKENVREVIEEFCKTIKVNDEKCANFAKQELAIDFTSFVNLGTIVPGFEYDKSTGRINLSPDFRTNFEKYLPLRLPILADTLHTTTPKKLDCSRIVTSLVFECAGGPNDRRDLANLSEKLHGVCNLMFGSKFGDSRKIDGVCEPRMHHGFMCVTSIISPNNPLQQLEATLIEIARFHPSIHFITLPGTMSILTDGGIQLEFTPETWVTERNSLASRKKVRAKKEESEKMKIVDTSKVSTDYGVGILKEKN